MLATRPEAPRPESYGEEYYARAYNLSGPRWTEINWWSVRFYARICQRLLRAGNGRRMLEIGCGLGFVLARLEKKYETYGIDLSPFAVEKANLLAPRSRVFAGDVNDNLPPELADGGFNLILARYVFEHLVEPGRAIQKVANLLAPGGALVYAVPDMTSPGRRLKGDDWYAYHDETHVSLLDPSEWYRLTELSGLSLEKVFSDGLWDVPYVRGIPRLLQYPLFSAPTIVSVALARPMIPPGWGENLIVVARRPHGKAS